MAADTGHISWKMPIASSTPPRATTPIDTPSRVWTPFVQSKLPFEQQSPIFPVSLERNVSATPSAAVSSSIAPRISASTSDETLRSSLSAARAELSNFTFQVDNLKKLVMDLEHENSLLKSDNNGLKQQKMIESFSSLPGDASKNTTVLQREIYRLQDELNHSEQRYQKALADHRLQKISLEADRDAKARELTRVQQELEEITVLYKGKSRCLQQMQELHEAQFTKDGTSRAEDKKKIKALSSHVFKLRDALLSLKETYKAEKSKYTDQQSRFETMKRLLEEANKRYESCSSELLSAQQEIDELLAQLSELGGKRKPAGGDCVRQVPVYNSDVVISESTPEPARSSTPTDPARSVPSGSRPLPSDSPSDHLPTGNPGPQRIAAYKDASTCTFVDAISETVHPDVLQKKLLDTEAQLSAERATICQLRAQMLDMEERERESEKLCDMLQSELDKMKKSCKLSPVKKPDTMDAGNSQSTLLHLCMDECNELRRQNAELAEELERIRNEVARKDEELQKLRVRLFQRTTPLHNPLAYDLSNDGTTVVNDSLSHMSSVL